MLSFCLLLYALVSHLLEVPSSSGLPSNVVWHDVADPFKLNSFFLSQQPKPFLLFHIYMSFFSLVPSLKVHFHLPVGNGAPGALTAPSTALVVHDRDQLVSLSSSRRIWTGH